MSSIHSNTMDYFITDEAGFIYSNDGTRLIKAASSEKRYRVREGVVCIEHGAFDGCTYGDLLDFPYTLHLDEDDLPPTEVMESVMLWDIPYSEVDSSPEALKCIDDKDDYVDEYGVIYSSNRKRLLGFQMEGKGIERYVVPDGVITICNYAFISNKCYMELIIPRSVRVIGSNLFGIEGGVIKIKTV